MRFDFRSGSVIRFGEMDFSLIYKGILKFSGVILGVEKVLFPYIRGEFGKVINLQGVYGGLRV